MHSKPNGFFNHPSHYTISPFSMPPQTDTIVPAHTPDVPSARAYLVPSTSLLAIEHPAILSSVEAGLRTLGGQHAIAKVPPLAMFAGSRIGDEGWCQAAEDHDNATLELRYRPQDRYQHPIISQRQKARNVVLQISKSKQHGNIKDIQVVGLVDTILRFRGIFTHIAQLRGRHGRLTLSSFTGFEIR